MRVYRLFTNVPDPTASQFSDIIAPKRVKDDTGLIMVEAGSAGGAFTILLFGWAQDLTFGDNAVIVASISPADIVAPNTKVYVKAIKTFPFMAAAVVGLAGSGTINCWLVE